MADSKPASQLVAVLDMGASAVRLVIADLTGKQIRIVEEASKAVVLGRDVFASGVIHARTLDGAIAALEGFRRLMDSYGVDRVRAVTTSAVREARNAEMALDRIRGRTGIAFDVINEAEESRLVYLAVRQALRRHPVFNSERALLVEVGGGSTGLTLLRRGRPSRSGVYGLGAVRMRQQLDLKRHSHELQVTLMKRLIANVVDEISFEIPLRRVTQIIAVGGDIRFVASQLGEPVSSQPARELTREAFLSFCDDVEQLDDEALVDWFRLTSGEAETLVSALLVYRTMLLQTSARRIVVADASLRSGVLLDLSAMGGRLGAEDFEEQVLASAESVGLRYRFDAAHGRHVSFLAVRLFDLLRDEHHLSDRDRLLLRVSALLHDIGMYVSLRGHHKHSQYLLAASQIFGLTREETAVVSNIARYHRRGLPQRTHLAYLELDSQDRLLVQKLAALLRVANALDAEHLQKVRDVSLLRHDSGWQLELGGEGDLTMEKMAATARADLFADVFGRTLSIRTGGVVE